MGYKLTITLPSGESPIVEYGRHFNVWGEILHDDKLSEDAVLTVKLMNSSGIEVRHVSQNKKNNKNVYLDHPDLTSYKEEIDPGKKQLLEFGFPELMVKNLEHPEESLRDATIKAFYSDEFYKAVITTASGKDYGMVWDDGLGLLDENGNPYKVLPCGDYTVKVELRNFDGELLAEASKSIVIARRKTQTIVRFSPIEHRNNMKLWCKDLGFEIIDDTFPGYLEPYTGKWYYHMGLLPMYRACDIALYEETDIHMFVYLVDPTSTSYETELAYLESQGVVGDPKRFRAYHYDIGEAVLKREGKEIEKGHILEFSEGEYLYIYRVDVVSDGAEENKLDLSGCNVKEYQTNLEKIEIDEGSKIAVSGVCRPWQLDPKDFELRKDNIYNIKNEVQKLHYEIRDAETGDVLKKETRKLMMERIDGESIGKSVFEFYNIFEIEKGWTGKTIEIKIIACDNNGEKEGAEGILFAKII